MKSNKCSSDLSLCGLPLNTSTRKSSKMLKLYILLFVTLLIFQVETEAGSCCLSYTKQPRRCANLKGYDIQAITGGCDLAAIVFHTNKGKSICADPAQQWTQNRVACLKVRAASVKNIGSGYMFV